MKKLVAIIVAGLFSSFSLAQTFPSPTFNSLTLQNPLTAVNGGTGASSATGTGSVVLNNAPAIASPTVTGTFTATGLVTTGDLATQAANTVLANVTGSTASPTAFSMPSCSASTSALNWTAGTGFGCNSAINAATLAGATFAAPGAIGSGTPNTGAFTTLSSTSLPTIGSGTLYPSVANNAALTSLSTATMSAVTRQGFTTAGDSPALNYTSSASACSLNSGAGDNGSQVQSANGKCWIAAFPPGPIDVREFGADPTNTIDSTTALQAAMNIGRPIYILGSFKFSTLTQSAGGIVGAGYSYSKLNSTDTTTANVITFSATNTEPGTAAPVFSGFALLGQTSKTIGAGLFVTAASGENDGAQFSNVFIQSFPTELQFGAAALWSIQNCSLINYSIAGVLIANTNNPDSGDSVLMGSWFVGGTGASPVGVDYQSSGGLKFIGNKINGGSFGFFLGLTASASTSDLLINGNSIENQTIAAIELSRQSGTANFSNIEIVGNQLAINPFGIQSDTSGAFSNVTIQGNAISLSSTTTGNGISLSNVATFNVSGNTIVGNGGTPVGIGIASTSSNGKIGKNTYNALTATLVNSSATTYYERDKQVIGATVTTSAAYGTALFTGSTVVTFAHAFTVAPEVTCQPSTSASGVSAIVSGVTITAFSLQVLGATSGGSVPVTCQAEGVI